MKYFLIACVTILGFSLPYTLNAAHVSFVVSPSTIPGDGAVIIEAILSPDVDDVYPLNAVEGRIGFLGKGSESITDVIIETGDSIFTFWPLRPVFSTEDKIIRFIGGTTPGLSSGGRILRMRIFTQSSTPIIVSWLGGSAHADDGLGTPIGIASQSLTVTPRAGEPNIISSTSEDSEPPRIESAIISRDTDTYDGRAFLSVHAIDDKTGISHFEVIEHGVTTRIESGVYLLNDQNLTDQLLVIAYDKAGNSVSIKVSEKNVTLSSTALLWMIIAISVSLYLLFRKLRKK